MVDEVIVIVVNTMSDVKFLIGILVLVATLIFMWLRRRNSRFNGYDSVIATLASSQVPEAKFNKLSHIKCQGEAVFHSQTLACSTSAASLIEDAVALQTVVKKCEKLYKENKTITADILIKKEVVGHLIGKLGSNIKQIQKESNTSIRLNESMLNNAEWVCMIHGNPESVNQAKSLVTKFIESSTISKVKNTFVTKELLVPKQCVGKIIGHDGRAIGSIKEVSKITIYIDMNRIEVGRDDGKEYRFVVLKGKKDQIERAESLILATVEGSTSLQNNPRKNGTETMALRVPGSLNNEDAGPSCGSEVSGEPKETLFSLGIGRESVDLRRLSQTMTHHYLKVNPWNSEEPESNFELGAIVAAPFYGKMYRARIIRFLEDSGVEVEYVDYGDRSIFEVNLIRVLLPEFLRTKFQAMAGSLNLLCPESKWPDEAIFKFCDMCHCAQWKSLTARFKGLVTDDNDDGSEMIERIWLELMDCDSNIGEKLIEKGLAKRKSAENEDLSQGA